MKAVIQTQDEVLNQKIRACLSVRVGACCVVSNQ